MCAFMCTHIILPVQVCLCMSSCVLIEQMAFAHGTSAQPCTCVTALWCVQLRLGMCVFVYLPPCNTCL